MSPATQEGRQVVSPVLADTAAAPRTTWIVAGVIAAALLTLPRVLSPDGQPHGNVQQFLGRFHPLAVHLPIGLLMLLPVLEIGGRWRPALREAAEVVLACAAVCVVGSVVLGILLAHGGGFAHDAVRGHMWAGLVLTMVVLFCALIRPAWANGENIWLYPTLLITALLLTAWTGHQGGALTYGKTYLTEFAPDFVKQMGPHKVYAPVDPVSVYATRIQPILDSNCVSCHAAAKIKGGLQLDSYGHLMDGGSSGAVIAAGNPAKSELLTRITLPADHRKFMPQEGKPLATKDIALIRSWIQQGASPSATAVTGMEVKTTRTVDPIPQVGDYSALAAQMASIEKTLGIRLEPFSSKPADGLVLRTIDVSKTFSDADLAKLEPFAPYIVDAELGHSKVADGAIPMLAKMRNLRAIHLEDTAVTGRDLKTLTTLPELRYLNLSNTKVTKQGLEPLASARTLQHVYIYNTPAQPAATPTP
jgi:uncharacterized membrane protein